MQPSEPDKQKGRDWIKYSGMGVQMIATILIFVFAGQYADGYFETGNTLTVILSLVGVAAGLYVALRDFF
ncbi:AtpZ/AtpI family protein [Lewinella sp. 4G2]|uniref:AtpZ/AtpI family protein n=1 Tax=Lewinella sp. 4G2 TaxID=1803372 RepID=UPI0007B47697|nr:AtpZ/AtpI family protein [Lewinella sp. 4G2]OAV42716.1 hypothetical protein A3850_015870 [Lewinella sp. 4G2]